MTDSDNRPLSEWSDEELRARPCSEIAKEQERRQASRARVRHVPQGDDRERQAAILRAHYSGEPPDWEKLAKRSRVAAADDRVSIDRERFEASCARVREAQERHVQRAQQANRDRADPLISAPARGGWERFVGRARLGLDERANGEPAASPYVDPDSLEAENRTLRTPDAQVVARHERGIGDAGRHPDLVRAEAQGRL